MTRSYATTVASTGLGKLTTASTVDGTNLIFAFSKAPTVVVVDMGRVMQKVSKDGNINWTGTTTITLQIAPTFDIYGL